MNATRQGDCCTGHDACQAVPLAEFSPDVNINGHGAGRLGDHYSSHGCATHSGHQDMITGGSATVFIDGKPAARVGDSVAIGGAVRDGSGDVFIGR